MKIPRRILSGGFLCPPVSCYNFRVMKEKNTFTIGDYTFSSFHEYRDGKEDLKKISVIQEKLDIQDPEVAVRIYKDIRDGRLSFKTDIGNDFARHISDIVAERSKGLIADRELVEEADRKTGYTRWIGIALTAAAAALFVYFGGQQLQSMKRARQAEELRAQLGPASEAVTETAGALDAGDAYSAADSTTPSAAVTGGGTQFTQPAADPFAVQTIIDPATLTILSEFQTLYERNTDLAGWLTIPDTDIDYPVLKAADNDFYLKRNFDKQKDSNGSLFVDARCDIVNPTTNTIIYGHNMHSGQMFGKLKNYYESEDFYRNHKTITFNTIYEHRTYEVVAVCLSEVKYQDSSDYRYYNFIRAANMDEWNAFVENVRAQTLYPADLDLTPGDQVLTLSTCDSYKDNGRLYVVAKRVS